MRLSVWLKIDFFISRGGGGLWSRLFRGCSGWVESCLRLEEWMAICGSMGSNLASLLTILLFVSAVCPVAIRAIWFCAI